MMKNDTDRESGDRSGRGMTQDQITDFLMKRMFRYSEGGKTHGALSEDKIQSYLAFIRGTVAKTLATGQLDILEIDDFVDMAEPIVTEMSEPETSAKKNGTALLAEIQHLAEQYVSACQADSAAGKETDTETAKLLEQEIPASGDAAKFLLQKIVPIGFEKGAPRISVSGFFEFPFGNDHFGQHLRYLEEAVSRGVFGADELSKIRSMLPRLPVLAYRKNYDIYPLNQFEETVLLVVFSLWQNKVLKNLLVIEEMDSPAD
ncbi:MAG: hypothetical protein HOD85_30835 [Deltaproteobacteria bacterium]|nr:hypothetical protein [Deltaproteobacteria bacterium]MBT4642979.1 hypothetical protein [Deltaproteobacteria bacterium]